ncbi:uncharacterized protein [Antedon mediterranea]|uniref:uncharacterized protein n=1 Tax=Antedon mediterranea TaxID=105859 RepID=UPI003AF9B1EB
MDNSEYTVDNTVFIGREKETQHLKELFSDAVLSPKSEIRRVIIITGEPMVGKTRLSKEIGNRLVSDFQLLDKQLNVYCIKLHQVTHFNRVLVKLSAALGLPPCSENALIKHFMQLKFHCLLIFDAAEHLSVDTSNELQTQFLDFCTRLVNNSKVLLLINSRFKYRLLSIHVNVYHHRLKPISIEDSIKLLTSVAENVGFVDSIDKKIAKYCAGIPHALVIAETELKNNTYTPHELFALLEENRLETLSSANYSEEENVSFVIKSSVNKLKSIRNDYIRLSYIPSSFTAKAVADILELNNEKPVVSAKQRVLIPLTTRSLVARDTLNDRFDIHAFLREFLSYELSSLTSEQSIVLRNRYCSFYGKLLQSLAPIVEEDSCKKLPLFSIELINIQKLLQEAAFCPSEDYDLFLDVACKAEYLIINFLPRKESVEFYAACVRAAESRNQKKHLGVMLSSYGQALTFTASNWKLAQEQYEKAVDILAAYGDTVDMAWLLKHIGWNLFLQGSFKVALRYFKDAEETLLRMNEIERKLDTRWERIIAAVWSCIGIAYVLLDSLKRGIGYHEKTLKMRRKIWDDHPLIGGTYNNMSLAYIRMGDQNKALEYGQKGLDTKMRFKREPANDIIVSLNNVAINTCIYEDNPKKAHRLLDQSFEMRELLGLNHVDTALIAMNRGRVYEYQENYSEAMVCYQRAVDIRENLQYWHKSTANSLFNLASLKLKFNQLDDALESFYKCYRIRQVGISQNTELGEVMESLGTVHEKRNEFSDANKYFMEALEEFNRLKKSFENQDNDSMAKEMGKNVERIRRKLQDLPFIAINNIDR